MSHKPRRSGIRWRWLLPAIALVALFHFTPLGPTLDRAFFDAASRRPLRAAPVPEGSAIVLMDNATLAMLKEDGLGVTWPPPRAVFAALIAGLERAGAKKIVLDFVFLENSSAVEQDQFLGALAAAVPSVVLATMPGKPIAFWDEAFLTAHPGAIGPRRMGHVDAVTDSDGVIRRYVAPGSLAGAAFDTEPSTDGGLLRWHGGLEQVRERVPVLSAARFVRAGLNVLPTLTAVDDPNSPRQLRESLATLPKLQGPGFDAARGKVVFVGANAEATFDQKPLAIGGLEPGVLVHWTAWTNLAGDGFIRPLPPLANLLLALGALGVVTAIGGRYHGTRILGLASAGLSLLVLTLAYAGLSAGWFLGPATPVFALAVGAAGMVAENYWTEHRRRQEVQAMFGSYVAPSVVEQLVRDPGAIRLGGERREATVFFGDLAGFTDLSEQVSPEELLELVNGFLEETSDCLLRHGAYVDKFIGDAVMAVFGVPQAQREHALSACRAALEAQLLLEQRNIRLAAQFGRTLRLRIGLNTGELIVGNVGSARKRNYTVLGDTVNLASRLEGANKEFGTAILIGPAVAAAVRDQLVVRPLPALRVKGKQQAVPVFELVGEPGTLPTQRQAFLRQYEQGHALYMARHFAEAAVAFDGALQLDPADLMTQRLLTSARTLAAHPPASDWQPILSLDTK